MKFALLFPGQGSQAVGMMAALAAEGVVRETFEEASDILAVDLWKLVSEGPAEELDKTTNTQPVMLTAGIATYRLFLAAGGRPPDVAAGHSLGEYTALTAAGVLSLAQALPLVRLRAQAMQEAVAAGEGAMAAILGLSDKAVREACAASAQGEVLEAVNLNAPGQVVIAGTAAAVARGIEAAKARGAKRAVLLPVSVPSHCALMRPAAETLGAYLGELELASPAFPVLQNADVQAYAEAEQIEDALVRQLYRPVRWVETIQTMASSGVEAAGECGPGKVLAGLNKRIAPAMTVATFADRAAIDAFVELINQPTVEQTQE